MSAHGTDQLANAADIVLDDYTQAGHRRDAAALARLAEIAGSAGVTAAQAEAVLVALADHLEGRAAG